MNMCSAYIHTFDIHIEVYCVWSRYAYSLFNVHTHISDASYLHCYISFSKLSAIIGILIPSRIEKEAAHFLIFREMRCFFFNSWRNLFVLNFQVTSRRFCIDPICSLHSCMKFMFRLRHENLPSPHVLLHIQCSTDGRASAVKKLHREEKNWKSSENASGLKT